MLKLDLRFLFYVKIICSNNLCIETGQENVKELGDLKTIQEPDSSDLGVNETFYNSDVIVGEEEGLKDEDRNLTFHLVDHV